MKAIAHAVIECLKDHDIEISKARDQNYDGAQCMSSDKVGVQARESCYTHELCMYTAAALSSILASPMPVDYLPSGIWSTPLIQYSFSSICPPNDTDSRNES